MSAEKRFSGIYDLRTLNFLSENNIRHYIFDFRPTSLNFLQEYKAVEFLNTLQTGQVFLLFRSEKSFMIERIYKSCRDVFGGEIFIEIEGTVDEAFTDLSLPFYYRFLNREELVTSRNIFTNSHCRGHVYNYEMLKDLHENNNFLSWIKEYYQVIGTNSLSLKQDILLDWDSDIFPSLFEYLDFDSMTLPINHKIEVCYRNVDLNKVSNNIKHLPYRI